MQSSVLLFSGMKDEGLFFMAAVWAFIGDAVLSLAGISIDILSWVVLTMLVGSIMMATWSLAKRRRFRILVTDQELLSLFEEVKRDLGKGNDIELWYRDIDRQVFLPNRDPLFKAILFSGGAIADILEKREKGRVLLARAVLEIERSSRVAQSAKGVLLFTILALFQGLAFFNIFEVMVFSLGTGILTAVIIAVFGMLVIVPVAASRKNTDIDDTIERLYGTPADAASLDVLFGLQIPDELLEEAKREGDDKPGRNRTALRNSTIALLIVVPTSFAIFMLSGFVRNILPFGLLMALVVGAGAFFMVYLTSMMWPLMTMGRGPRSTEWDIELPLAEAVQGFLNHQESYENLKVRGIKPPFDDKVGLVILRLRPDYDEETLHAVMPHMVEDLRDVELLGPLIFAELKVSEIEGRERRIGFRVVAIATPFLVIGILWSFMASGIEGLLFGLFQMLFIYLLITMIPMGYTTWWRKKSVVRAEAEIAERYPKYREALQTLIKNHHTLPYGQTSYKTRLERIDRYLGTDAPEETSGLG